MLRPSCSSNGVDSSRSRCASSRRACACYRCIPALERCGCELLCHKDSVRGTRASPCGLRARRCDARGSGSVRARVAAKQEWSSGNRVGCSDDSNRRPHGVSDKRRITPPCTRTNTPTPAASPCVPSTMRRGLLTRSCRPLAMRRGLLMRSRRPLSVTARPLAGARGSTLAMRGFPLARTSSHDANAWSADKTIGQLTRDRGPPTRNSLRSIRQAPSATRKPRPLPRKRSAHPGTPSARTATQFRDRNALRWHGNGCLRDRHAFGQPSAGDRGQSPFSRSLGGTFASPSDVDR